MPVEYDEIGAWSEIKLEIVRKYAQAYSVIMAKQGFHHTYLDAFAGPGVHLSRASGEFVPGSPLNALLVQPPFEQFHFVDADGGRAKRLRELSRGVQGVEVHEGDCNAILPALLEQIQYRQRRRALCILDPYNIDLDWKLVMQAGRLGTVEIFLTLMVMDINRNVLRRNTENVSPSWVEKMSRLLGDDSWRTVAYATRPGLFEDMEEKTGTNRALAEAYRERLRSIAGFQYVPEPRPMKNSSNATLYYLYFASPNKTGNKIVEEIFRRHRGG